MSAGSERLTTLLRAVGDSRRRLEGLARRLVAAQQLLGGARKPSGGGEDDVLSMEEEGPGGTSVIDDAELNFEALDIEDGEGERG